MKDSESAMKLCDGVSSARCAISSYLSLQCRSRPPGSRLAEDRLGWVPGLKGSKRLVRGIGNLVAS